MQVCRFNLHIYSLAYLHIKRPRSTMDSIRASEAPDAGSIPAEATIKFFNFQCSRANDVFSYHIYNPHLCIFI